MKKWVIIGLIPIMSASLAMADEDNKKDVPSISCPKTLITDQVQCLTCHTKPNFKIKEAEPFEGALNPEWLRWHGDEAEGYLLIEDIKSNEVLKFYRYMKKYRLKKATIEIFSPGGSMMQAWRIINIMRSHTDIETTTIVRGYAASAGFMIFIAGDRRLIASTALMMWHEVISAKLFDISTPSDKEEEARILRFFQDNADEWLVSRSKVTKQKLDALIHKKEFWMSGKQAVEMGFADGMLGQ